MNWPDHTAKPYKIRISGDEEFGIPPIQQTFMSSLSSPSLPLYKPPPPPFSFKTQPPPMAGEGQWETFIDDNDDCLSLVDLPLGAFHDKQEQYKSCQGIEEFEFRTFGGGGSLLSKADDMCAAADEIFFKGKLLPYRPRSNCYSSSRSSSSRGSSSCISRSHSSSSNSSNCELPMLSTISNNFYAHPSPTPQVRTSVSSAPRRSTGSAPPGWALFRVGLVKTPDIELNDLRSRRMRANECKSGAKKEKKRNMPMTLFSFGCNCGADAVQPMQMNPIRALPVAPPMPKKGNAKEKKGEDLKKEEIMWRSRMSEWLEELSIGKEV